jgi:hypothetical protein
MHVSGTSSSTTGNMNGLFPRIVLVVSVLCLITHVTSSDVAILPGDVTLAGLFTVQEVNPEGVCSSISEGSVQTLEAVKWVLEQLNGVNYVDGVKLGKCLALLYHHYFTLYVIC